MDPTTIDIEILAYVIAALRGVIVGGTAIATAVVLWPALAGGAWVIRKAIR